MKITKEYLKKIIKEELEESNFYSYASAGRAKELGASDIADKQKQLKELEDSITSLRKQMANPELYGKLDPKMMNSLMEKVRVFQAETQEEIDAISADIADPEHDADAAYDAAHRMPGERKPTRR